MMNWWYSLLVATTYLSAASSTTITDIQGTRFLSPLAGQTVTNVSGIVTAKGSSGFYLLGDKSDDIRVSNGLQVFTTSTSILSKVNVGDLISLDGEVQEFRSSSSPNDLFSTEIEFPTNIVVRSSNNTFPIVVLGKDRSPPTQQLSALDVGPDGFLSVPNNVSRVDTVNAELQPDLYGLDFWESLEGQIVTIPKPVATNFENSFGEFWVYGDWPVTGKNARGGISITFGPDGIPDANPETIIIGSPLDKTKNPKTAVGVGLTDITGVVLYQFGFFYVLPLTAPQIILTPSSLIPPTTITSNPNDTSTVTIADYNVDNLGPTSAHVPDIASHIATLLKTPDLLFIQEIQDNSGETDDGTVDADVTIAALTSAIESLSGVKYNSTQISPIDNQDGGVPGGNIRTVYLYRPERLQLISGVPAGGPLDAIAVRTDTEKLALSLNPGRIDPTNEAWTVTRKPLVASWQTASGAELFTINVHLSSKDGGSSTQGDARPPVNLPVDRRTEQVAVVADFVQQMLERDPQANIVVAGDFNEFVQARSVYKPLTQIMTELDEVVDLPVNERYSYVFDQSSEQLDHIFVSPSIQASKGQVAFEHIHVNNWAPSFTARISDHDPSVAKIVLH
ncbi:DNase I-like protein [Macrolepiota fuliginosa MF-IS2]|uniref:DNase I-like protein n=1 Tax=Macrolepiota fuliginosa MF-IS2 TaxID=1400762 RepID=A0A9P5XSQ7_9AGAR|nr:DNase I-like protein [Macrolepiota fuliginosa MF-IS2]